MTDPSPPLPDVPSLRVVEPRPGGLDRLRATLDREARRPSSWLIAAPIVALAAFVVWLAIGAGDDRSPRAPSPTSPSLEARALADPSIAPGDRVTFYWVASQPGDTRPTAPLPVADGLGQPALAITP